MLNTVTGRIILTAQNQTRAAFGQASKDLRSLMAVGSTITAIGTTVGNVATKGIGAFVDMIGQIPTTLLEVDTAFRDSMIVQARFENTMKNFNLGHMSKEIEEFVDKQSMVWGQSSNQMLLAGNVFARVAHGNTEQFKRSLEGIANYAAAIGTTPVQAAERIERASTSAFSAIRMLREATGRNLDMATKQRLQLLEEYGAYDRMSDLVFQRIAQAQKGAGAALNTAAGQYRQTVLYTERFSDRLGKVADPLVQRGLQYVNDWINKINMGLERTPAGEWGQAIQNIFDELTDNKYHNRMDKFWEDLWSGAYDIVVDWSTKIEKFTAEQFAKGWMEGTEAAREYLTNYLSWADKEIQKGARQREAEEAKRVAIASRPPLSVEAPPMGPAPPAAKSILDTSVYELMDRLGGAINKPAIDLYKFFTSPAGPFNVPAEPVYPGKKQPPQPGEPTSSIETDQQEIAKNLGFYIWEGFKEGWNNYKTPAAPIIVPGMQHGGHVRSGQSVIVGEAGPELFTPGSHGYVHPASFGGRPFGGMGSGLKDFSDTLKTVNKDLDDFDGLLLQIIDPLKLLIYGRGGEGGGGRGGGAGGGAGGAAEAGVGTPSSRTGYNVPVGYIPPPSVSAPPMGPGTPSGGGVSEGLGKTQVGASKDLTGVQKQVWDWGVSKGMNRAQIGALMATIKQESSFRSGASGDPNVRGGSHGLFQMNRERFARLTQNVPDWQRNVVGQLENWWTEPEKMGGLSAFKKAKTPEEATVGMLKNIRPLEWLQRGVGGREFSNRLKSAQQFMETPTEAATGAPTGITAPAPVGPSGGQVKEMQSKIAGIRKGALAASTRSYLEYASAQTGLAAEVFSGGQPAAGGRRTGSHRHDLGGSADINLRDPQTGRLLDMRVPADAKRMADFVTKAVSAGATGVGAGVGYMGPSGIHIGGGKPATWGGASWIRKAWEAGRGQKMDPSQVAKDVVSTTVTEPTKDVADNIHQEVNRAAKGMRGGSFDALRTILSGGNPLDIIRVAGGGRSGGGPTDPFEGHEPYAYRGREGRPSGVTSGIPTPREKPSREIAPVLPRPKPPQLPIFGSGMQSDRMGELPSFGGNRPEGGPSRRPPLSVSRPYGMNIPSAEDLAWRRAQRNVERAERIGEAQGVPIPREKPQRGLSSVARNPYELTKSRDVSEDIQLGVAKKRDPTELFQQAPQSEQWGRGQVDVNLKLDKQLAAAAVPIVQNAEHFDVGVGIDRTGYFARPGDPTYRGVPTY